MSTQSTSHVRFLWGVGLLLGFLFFWIASLFFSANALLKALQRQEVAAVARHSRYLHVTSSTLSWLTFRASPTIESIDALLGIASKADSAAQILTTIQTTASTEAIDLSELFSLITSLQQDVNRLEKNVSNCNFCNKFLSNSFQSKLAALLPSLQTASALSSHLSTGTHRYLVVFQNSDELRATGGFMGSYAVVSIMDGVLQPLVIEDIYDADGQFTGKLPAPDGVAQYLSSDNGLRLPDANWAPHFPTSAKQMLQFFALGERDNFEGVIALTDTYFEDLLDVIGPIWLPDYQVAVTPKNLTSVLRTDREDFFAGSIQKKHLLGQFQNQVVIALSQDKTIVPKVMEITLKHMRQKNILAYSSNDSLQAIFGEFGVDGSLFTQQADSSLAFIESNVGINKANRHITRKLSLSSSSTTLVARYLISNANQAPQTTQLTQLVETQSPVKTATNQAHHLGYVNYQRVIYPANWTLTDIASTGTTEVETHSNSQIVPPGREMTETGFLVVVPEQQEVLVTLTFNTHQQLTGTTLELFKQPGTNPLPVWLETNQTTPFTSEPTLILEKNNVTIMP